MINKRFHKSYQDHETHETYMPHEAHRPHLSFVIRHSSFVILLSLFTLSFFTLLSGCASMSSPDGGPYDETPPRVVRSTPDNQAVNADKKNIRIDFDEYIKIENASEKVVVSPPQREIPNVRAVGKHVQIELFDSLRPNTTYTIDFSDAIVDNNEGNPMGNYAFSFSTGPTIDTMEVSGYVLNAEDLEPIKGIQVGLYLADDDSIVPDSVIRTRPFDRVSRTNGSGRFVIKGVARDRKYRAFALKDMDGDQLFSQKSEQVAADTALFSATCGPDIRLDTIWHDETHYDSITPVRYIHFYPDDLVLRAFIEEGQDRHLLKIQRDVPEKFTAYFTAPSDSLPIVRGVHFEGDGGFILEPSAKADTITYWITDTTLAYADTLALYYTYQESDTLHQLYWKTDTLNIVPKTSHAKQLKELAQKTEEWEKEQKKKRKRNPSLPPEENPHLATFLKMECKPGTTIAPNQTPLLVFSEPVAPLDSNTVHFQIKVDSLWEEEPFELVPVPNQPRQYRLYADWESAQQYRLEIDSATVQGLLGHTNKPISEEFRVRKEEEFGALFVHVLLPDTNVIVQLMNSSDKPITSQHVNADGRADFFYLKPGPYYLRCFIDSNHDGVWTTGDYDAGQRPEETFYFPQAINVKARIEVSQDWDVRGIPAMKQKPLKITKQKPDKEKKIKQRNLQREASMQRESRRRQ